MFSDAIFFASLDKLSVGFVSVEKHNNIQFGIVL